jgi:hypothetical protein
MSTCHRWNYKEATDKTWTYFKIHFATAHRQQKQMQGEYAASSRNYDANANVDQTE